MTFPFPFIPPSAVAAVDPFGFGALVTKAADQTTADYTTPTMLAFDLQIYEYGDWHSTSTNNTRLTVPSGVSYVRLTGQVGSSLNSNGALQTLEIYKNGAALSPRCANSGEYSTSTPRTGIATPALAVTPSDYFELRFTNGTDASITIDATETWFAIEMIE